MGVVTHRVLPCGQDKSLRARMDGHAVEVECGVDLGERLARVDGQVVVPGNRSAKGDRYIEEATQVIDGRNKNTKMHAFPGLVADHGTFWVLKHMGMWTLGHVDMRAYGQVAYGPRGLGGVKSRQNAAELGYTYMAAGDCGST